MTATRSVFVGLGSNMGDRRANVERAISLLSSRPDVVVVAVSSLYETEPRKMADQPWFLNAAVELSTSLSPEQLLSRLKYTERVIGRVRRERFGPREIDLDLLMYGDLVCNRDDLTLPHPNVVRYRFCLVPLAEIAPEFVHPIARATIEQLCERSTDDGAVRRFEG